jgi:hypothetical protein
MSFSFGVAAPMNGATVGWMDGTDLIVHFVEDMGSPVEQQGDRTSDKKDAGNEDERDHDVSPLVDVGYCTVQYERSTSVEDQRRSFARTEFTERETGSMCSGLTHDR